MKRSNIYLVLILFLLVTNAATIVTVRTRRINSLEKETPVIRKPAESRMDFFWGELGLSETQRSDFNRFSREFNRKAGEITRSMTGLRHDIVEEMSSESPDRDNLDSVINEFGNLHSDLKRVTVDFYDQLNSVCDTQQRERLEFMFRDMLDPEGVIYGRGRGGEGRGREFRQRGPGRGRGGGRGVIRELN